MQERRGARRATESRIPQHRRNHGTRHLAKAGGPAVLLAHPMSVVGRELARHRYRDKEHAAPALEPGAIAKVEILGNGIAAPTAARLDRGAAPNAARAVEAEGMSGPAPRR